MKKITLFVVLLAIIFAAPTFAAVYTRLIQISNADGILVLEVQAKSDDGAPLISLYRGAFKVSQTLEKRVVAVGFESLLFFSPNYITDVGYSSEYRKFTWIYDFNEERGDTYASIPEDWLSVLRVAIMYNTGDEIASLSWTDSPSYKVLDENGNDITGDYIPMPPDLEDLPLPVSMHLYSAVIDGDKAVVSWRTESETNNLGFNIYRSETEASGYTKVNGDLIRGQGTTPAAHDYEFVDTSIAADKEYWYTIETISYDGLSTFYGPFKASTISGVAADGGGRPTEFRLLQNYPNPFNPSTQISYELPTDSDVTLTIYNILGSKVRTLVDARQTAGAYTARWDGTDNHGARLESGIFIYELRAGQQVFYQKMTMMK